MQAPHPRRWRIRLAWKSRDVDHLAPLTSVSYIAHSGTSSELAPFFRNQPRSPVMTNNPDTTVAGGDAGKDSSAPLPSFEEQSSPQNPVMLNPDTRRIYWTLNGPLETAITVARDYSFDPNEVPEPYYRGFSGDNREPTWHPFSQSPLSEPKVSSLRLYVDPLDEWDYFWMENHEGHSEPDEICDPAMLLYGPLPDADEYEKMAGDKHLLVCCRMKRPRGKETQLVVKAAGNFVTIHDFISVVHPYLMARRDEILEAMNEDPGRFGKPFLPETKLMVDWDNPKAVDVSHEARWLALRKRDTPFATRFPPTPSTQRIDHQLHHHTIKSATCQYCG